MVPALWSCLAAAFLVESWAVSWGLLGENLPRVRLSDFDGLKFFIYPLPPKFHANLLDTMESQGENMNSNCDFMRSPCSEEGWSGAYSVARQWGAEVIILRKLLASSARVLDAHDADFFVSRLWQAFKKYRRLLDQL